MPIKILQDGRIIGGGISSALQAAQSAQDAAASAELADSEGNATLALQYRNEAEGFASAAADASQQPYPDRAAAVAAIASLPAEITRVGWLDALGRAYFITRQSGATDIADMVGWTPSGMFVQPRHYGAVGDGVADDTAAVQAALDDPRPYVGDDGDIYRMTQAGVYKSNKAVFMSGSRLLRGFKNGWLLQNENRNNAILDTNITISGWYEDDETNDTRGNFLLAAGVKDFIVTQHKVRASSQNLVGESVGAWSMYVEGEDVTLGGIDVDNSACALFGDGLHFGSVKRLTIESGFRIRAGDDAIAFFGPPEYFSFVNINTPSQFITVGDGFVSSAHANGVRIGGWGVASTPTDFSPPNVYWLDVNIGRITFGPCGSNCINLSDSRNPSEISGQSDNISFAGLNFGEQSQTLRLIAAFANPDIANAANRDQKNINRLSLGRMTGVKAGTSGQILRMGGIENLEFIDPDFNCATTVATSTARLEFRQIGILRLKSPRFALGTVGVGIQTIYVNDTVVTDPDSKGSGAFTFWNAFSNADQPSEITVTGGRLSGDQRGIYDTGTTQLTNFVLSGTDIRASVALANPRLKDATRFVWNSADGVAP